jgi:L-fuconolactonase
MIIDSHCHAWTRWPYQPPVPDDASRGRIEQLLHEMDVNGVDRAAVVCAEIERNPDNNAYIAEQVACHPDRLYQIADVDSMWSPTYHLPGAADRLAAVADRWPIVGFTHYVSNDDDGEWLTSDDGLAFFRVAEERRLLASIHCQTYHHPAIRRVAERFPSVPLLIHHLGHVKATEPPQGGPAHEALKEVLASARLPNIYIKLSGFAYATAVNWDYPYADTHWVIRAEYEHFGPYRMCWGSDYPVVRFFMTYRQALEAFRTHCTFIPGADKAWILGKTLEGLVSLSR